MRYFIFLLLLVGGCTAVIHQDAIRKGMLQPGLSRIAFEREWGLPQRTRMSTGQEIISAGWGARGGGFFKGKVAYEIWVYENRDVELAFDNKKRLVGWKTDKSVQELSTPVGEKLKAPNQ